VQDAFVRLHDVQPNDPIRSLKSYLATITARLSLNRLRGQRARRETYVGEWLPEPLATLDEPEVRAEDVSFGLLAVLERLSPSERVVFVLRNAFDFTFEEIAAVVGRDVVTCRKIFSRARTRVVEERPRFTVDRERHRELLRSFTEAARGGETAKLVALLADRVELHEDGGGKVAVAQFVVAVTRALPPDAILEEIELNGAPGLLARSGGCAKLAIMIDTDGEHIHSIFAVANPDKLDAVASAH
jgi:RNA polymerase sigma-70 factor, ECF subfamily